MADAIHHLEDSDSLAQALGRLEAGEDVVLYRGGIPVARLTAVDPPDVKHRPSRTENQVWIADDFADLLAEDLTGPEDGS